MHCFVFQDWVTLRATFQASPSIVITTITQGEEGWLDLEPYQDIVAWVDVREVTAPTTSPGSLFLDFQTAPVKDEAYFASLLNTTGGYALTTTGTPNVVRMTKDAAFTPLSKWMRWQLNPGKTSGTFNTVTQAWDVTMRIWIAANYALSPMRGVSTTAPQPQGFSTTAAQMGGRPPIGGGAGPDFLPGWVVNQQTRGGCQGV